MILSGIKIENFKNYEKADLVFSPDINCLTGPNGAGKTNVLDAIYYLCTGKSYFNSVDQQLIFENADYFSIKGDFKLNEAQETILCVLIKGRRKVIKRNYEQYARMIDHYGAFPVVMVAPGDMDLIAGGSEERRKWLDSTISWVDKAYLVNLLKYDKILQQRNAELRKMENENPSAASPLIKIYDEMMIPVAEEIHKARNGFLADFLPFFNNIYEEISQNKETVSLQYLSAMHTEPLARLLENCLKKDMILQRTNAGPHRDDLEFLLDGSPLKKFGSQGQQKTFLLALKLAQHQYLKAAKKITPVLLLDDVCERLDEHRLSVLFRLIKERGSFGQVFVTDTSAERVKGFLDDSSGIALFAVDNGNIKKL
jgi:DNA replication and repair protein RecF